MSPWMVLLHGNKRDLRELEAFTDKLGGDILIHRSDGGKYYLKMGGFLGEDDAQEARKEASKFLEIYKGIAALQEGIAPHINLTHTLIQPLPDGRFRIATAFATVRKLRDGRRPKPKHGVSLIGLSKRDPRVAEILRLLGSKDHPWLTMRKVGEIIERSVGQQEINRWGMREEFRRFKLTANHLAGRSAVHATSVGRGSRGVHPMSEPEARAFIHSLTEKWIRSLEEGG